MLPLLKLHDIITAKCVRGFQNPRCCLQSIIGGTPTCARPFQPLLPLQLPWLQTQPWSSCAKNSASCRPGWACSSIAWALDIPHKKTAASNCRWIWIALCRCLLLSNLHWTFPLQVAHTQPWMPSQASHHRDCKNNHLENYTTCQNPHSSVHETPNHPRKFAWIVNRCWTKSCHTVITILRCKRRKIYCHLPRTCNHFFVVDACCLSADRTWDSRVDQQRLQPPPVIFQRWQDRRHTNWAIGLPLPRLTDYQWWFESLLVHSGVSSATRRKATGANQKGRLFHALATNWRNLKRTATDQWTVVPSVQL